MVWNLKFKTDYKKMYGLYLSVHLDEKYYCFSMWKFQFVFKKMAKKLSPLRKVVFQLVIIVLINEVLFKMSLFITDSFHVCYSINSFICKLQDFLHCLYIFNISFPQFKKKDAYSLNGGWGTCSYGKVQNYHHPELYIMGVFE